MLPGVGWRTGKEEVEEEEAGRGDVPEEEEDVGKAGIRKAGYERTLKKVLKKN